jgi:uncharacterized RDD family membrane protein YckC
MTVASSSRRFFAYFVDKIIEAVLLMPLWIQLVASWVSDQALTIQWHWLIFCFVLQFCYRFLFTQLLGGTLGKLLFGLRVMSRHSDDSLTWMQSFLRALTDQLTWLFGPAHQLLLLARFDRTHLSDWVAETQVKQVVEGNISPSRNIPFALLISLYVAYSDFFSAYELMQRSEWSAGTLTIHSQSKSNYE